MGNRLVLWDIARQRKLTTGPAANASSLDFAPDGRLLAAKDPGGAVLVLDVPSMTERAWLSGEGIGEGPPVRFAPDGRHLVVASWSGLLALRELHSGSVVWQDVGASIFRLSCSWDRQAWVYDRFSGSTGEVLVRRWPFDEHAAERVAETGTLALAISGDGRRVAVAHSGLVLFEPGRNGGEWRVTASIDEMPRSGPMKDLAWLPDGELLLYASGRRVTLYDTKLGVVHTEKIGDHVSKVDVATTGHIAFGCSQNGLVTLTSGTCPPSTSA